MIHSFSLSMCDARVWIVQEGSLKISLRTSVLGNQKRSFCGNIKYFFTFLSVYMQKLKMVLYIHTSI